METQKVLAIETSCDDTSVSLVSSAGFVFECLSANQDSVHLPFGGIVPEVASRNHTLTILSLISKLQIQSPFQWNELLGIAVTSRPGLVGSLLVGIVTAKTLALVHNLKFIGINHLEGHLLAAFLHDKNSQNFKAPNYPFIALAVSGGHTQLYYVKGLGDYEVLGRTLDDAAGEALDKFAKHLGLGFPGGVKIDQLSMTGDPTRFDFPRTMRSEANLDYSFSGLKSAAIRIVDNLGSEEIAVNLPHLCASYQEAVVDSLLSKLKLAVKQSRIDQVVITGGVSANSRLRAKASAWAHSEALELFIPPLRYCTDNAAMIGYVGAQKILRGEFHGQNLNASASNWPNDFKESSI